MVDFTELREPVREWVLSDGIHDGKVATKAQLLKALKLEKSSDLEELEHFAKQAILAEHDLWGEGRDAGDRLTMDDRVSLDLIKSQQNTANLIAELRVQLARAANKDKLDLSKLIRAAEKDRSNTALRLKDQALRVKKVEAVEANKKGGGPASVIINLGGDIKDDGADD